MVYPRPEAPLNSTNQSPASAFLFCSDWISLGVKIHILHILPVSLPPT